MSKRLDRSRLDTVQLVPPTPFTPGGDKLVPDVLSALVRDLSAAGIRVFLPAAGTGEFHSLSVDEVVSCVRATREAVSGEAVVIAPIGFGVAHAIAIGQRSLDAGGDALLLMPPIHPYLCDAGFRDYFLAISDQLAVPLLTYKRGTVPSDRLLVELAEAGRLIGVKYAVNDLDAFAHFALAIRGQIGLYCGTAERWAPYFMLAGATGYTSGVGSVAPRVTLALHRALTAGDYQHAKRPLQLMRPLEDYRARDGDSYNIAAIKYAVSSLGRDFGPCRPPQRRLTVDEQSGIRKLIEPLLNAERELK